MWTILTGLFLLVGLALSAFFVGQAARRRFPKTYTAVDKTLFGIEFIVILVVFFGLFYLAR